MTRTYGSVRGAGGFSHLELTDVKGAETLTYGGRSRVRCASPIAATAAPGRGSRFLQDSGGKADLIVRMRWNSFHLTAADGRGGVPRSAMRCHHAVSPLLERPGAVPHSGHAVAQRPPEFRA